MLLEQRGKKEDFGKAEYFSTSKKKKNSQTFYDLIVKLEQRVNANKELNCP